MRIGVANGNRNRRGSSPMGVGSSQMESSKLSRSSRMGSVASRMGSSALPMVRRRREWVRRRREWVRQAALRMGSSGLRMGSSGGVANGFVSFANGSSASRMGLAASQMGSSGGVTNGFVRRRRQCVRRWCIWEAYQLMVYGTAKIKKRRDKMMSKGSIYIQVFSDENAPSPMPFKFVANVSHF